MPAECFNKGEVFLYGPFIIRVEVSGLPVDSFPDLPAEESCVLVEDMLERGVISEASHADVLAFAVQ